MGDAGGAVLVAPGVAPVGVALGVADENGDIAVEDIFVHQHRVPPAGGPQVHHMFAVLAVMAGELAGVIELAEQLLPQDLFHLRHGGPGVQSVGDQQQDVLLLHPGGIQLIQAGPDGHLPVGSGLTAALDDIGDDEYHRFAGARQLPEGLHADGVPDALQRGGVQAVPVLGQAGRIRDGLPGDKHVGIVRQLGGHEAVTVFKIQFHFLLS